MIKQGKPPNIMAIILSINKDNLYQLGIKDGVLQTYSYSEFKMNASNFFLACIHFEDLYYSDGVLCHTGEALTGKAHVS